MDHDMRHIPGNVAIVLLSRVKEITIPVDVADRVLIERCYRASRRTLVPRRGIGRLVVAHRRKLLSLRLAPNLPTGVDLSFPLFFLSAVH